MRPPPQQLYTLIFLLLFLLFRSMLNAMDMPFSNAIQSPHVSSTPAIDLARHKLSLRTPIFMSLGGVKEVVVRSVTYQMKIALKLDEIT